MPEVWPVRAPADLLGRPPSAFRVHEWLAPPVRAMPGLRRVIDELFTPLAGLDAEDPAARDAYLAGAVEPLARLSDLRMQLVAVSPRAPTGTTRYVIAPSVCLFQIEAGAVHLLGAPCPGAARELSGTGGFRWWASRPLLEAAFAAGVPWCPACGLSIPG